MKTHKLSHRNKFFGVLVSSTFGLISVTSGYCSPIDFAVSDMKLGQSVDEIKTNMHKYKQGSIGFMKERNWPELPGVSQSIGVVWGSVDKDDQYGRSFISKDYLQATFGQTTGKAYLIIRRVGVKAGETFNLEEFTQKLIDNYGTPTENDPGLTKVGGYRSFSWSYDKNGKPTKGCGGYLINEAFYEYDVGMINSHCGITLYVNLHLNEKNIVDSYKIHMADEGAILRDMEEIARRINEEKTKIQASEKKANEGKQPTF